MRPSFWRYENDTFRGRVLKYTGNLVESIPCAQVRKNRLKALDDARKKIRELRKVVQ